MIWLGDTLGANESLRALLAASGSEPTGPLDAARQAMGQTYGGAELIDPLELSRDDLWTCLNYGPFEVETEDLTPGALAQLTSWLTDTFSTSSSLVEQIQARVRPEDAVKLLT